MKFPFSPTRSLLTAALLLLAAGCSFMESDRVDYKSAGRGVSLEVPPDLTQLPDSSRYAIPGTEVTASGYAATQAAQDASGPRTAPNVIADVHFKREGELRWVHVERDADQIWGQLRDFWLDHGFLLTVDQPNAGLMETDWAENRAKIPQDIIRRTIGKVFDSLYSTGERDRFRTRVERTADGGTDIYITHQGMEEVYSSARRDSTVWQPRDRDTGLETEFLRRLMVKLGVSEEQSRVLAEVGAASAALPERAELATLDGAPAVQMQEGFDSAWRRVGLALDRTGFNVEDRDRSQGIYYVRYVDPTLEKEKQGFFERIFRRKSAPLPTERYQVLVRTSGASSVVTVQDNSGARAPAEDSQRILQVLADELK